MEGLFSLCWVEAIFADDGDKIELVQTVIKQVQERLILCS